MIRTPQRRLLFIALTLAVAVLPIAVGVSGAGATQQKTIRIGLVLPLLSNPFIAPVRDGAVAEAKKLGNIQVLDRKSVV